jgi:membrane fusion protein (multidrug efflux system)
VTQQQKSVPTRRRRIIRPVAMAIGILAVVVGGAWFYLTSGRYIGTDNAYIKAAKILITPEVTGTILTVHVGDNQPVKKGDVLFTIDPMNYQIALAKAEADLATAKSEVANLKAEYAQQVADMQKAQVLADYADKQYRRMIALKNSTAVSQSQIDQVASQRDAALKEIASYREQANQYAAQLDGNPNIAPDDQSGVRAAAAALMKAQLDIERTTVRAPADGIIGTAPHVGDYARASVPELNMVGDDSLWIEANYKETELTGVRPGQPVKIEVDTYPGHQWTGTVESISPATGSEFSVLPAQNSTGNWVKVVQRIAVRIEVDRKSEELPLRAGMSTNVTIDTGYYPHWPGSHRPETAVARNTLG